MKRTFAIGDIHGAYKALEQIMKKIDITENDTLIFLGDYVDGWSESKEVIDYLIELNEKHHCIFIKGNHDEWCEDWLQNNNANATWLVHGGEVTVKSYESISPEEKAKHLEFFNRLQHFYIDEDNNLFIHAGFSSMHGPQQEVYSSNYKWDRTLWEMALTMDKRIQKDSKSYPKRLKLFKEIFIGHTPTLNYDVLVPMNGVNVWNVDTGAAFNGKLSVLNVETKEFWQSAIVQTLYPNEKGRNKN